MWNLQTKYERFLASGFIKNIPNTNRSLGHSDPLWKNYRIGPCDTFQTIYGWWMDEF